MNISPIFTNQGGDVNNVVRKPNNSIPRPIQAQSAGRSLRTNSQHGHKLSMVKAKPTALSSRLKLQKQLQAA